MEENMPGKIIYNGKSLLDNKTPIIAVAVNGNKSAPNSKPVTCYRLIS